MSRTKTLCNDDKGKLFFICCFLVGKVRHILTRFFFLLIIIFLDGKIVTKRGFVYEKRF